MIARWFRPLFFLSGACALGYQVVWLRLAMARYGVTAPIVAIVLSVFMGGIAVGSLLAGALARRGVAPDRARGAATPLRLYALAELSIALSGLLVPRALAAGSPFVLVSEAGEAWSSLAHYLASGVWIAAVLGPGAIAMGATVPLALWAIRAAGGARSSEHAFTDLYLANTLGALAGTLLAGFALVELFGFSGTSRLAAGGNLALAAAAFALSVRAPRLSGDAALEIGDESSLAASVGSAAGGEAGSGRIHLVALAATGFASLGMEVIWTRLFTSFLGTEVYAFALVLALYLAATACGAALHRWRSRAAVSTGIAKHSLGSPAFWGLLAAGALLPLLAADPRLGVIENPNFRSLADLGYGALRVGLGIVPFCLLAGFMTPRLVDAASHGEPKRAAKAYAINLAGCIVGPLVAGFLLLPHFGERAALALLALPLAALALLLAPPAAAARKLVPAALAGFALLLLTEDGTSRFGRVRVERDYAATSIAAGAGMERRLLVNGIGMTHLTPITKMMAHLPLVLLDHPPKAALVICLGMGTTFRSIAAWQIDATAVELVPGVVRLFDSFHDDVESVLAAPAGARIVVDDGRRFLERTSRRFDVITIDPPPPVTAAGSSLLYSKQFYAVARARLEPRGIVQQWLPGGDEAAVAAAARALAESFTYVRGFESLERWGIHFLASDRPIELPSRDELERRIRPEVARDLLEWTPKATVTALFGQVLSRELPLAELLARAPGTPAVTDDRPVNEYFLLRTLGLR